VRRDRVGAVRHQRAANVKCEIGRDRFTDWGIDLLVQSGRTVDAIRLDGLGTR
jgi:hypothetical protein